MKKQSFTILIQGYNGVGANRDAHEMEVPVHCTEKQLATIAKAMIAEYRIRYDFVCCVAAVGDYVTNNHWDYMFADCM